ncbi:MAG: type I restriction endonuclease subunit R [Actinomycetota bacterium]|nr:type I restriction endonuclease subunit R [Actinomycetota bacterium]
MTPFAFNEEHLSQIPALQLLMSLGYECLSPEQALALRGGRLGNVILEDVLREQIKSLNRIAYKGGDYLFSEENVQSAIQRLKSVKFDGLQRINEAVYDLLTLGTTLEQTIEGDSRSFNLRYIDWENPGNNVYHVSAEFAVERTRTPDTARPDIVLFVNGIPLAVIECKSPSTDLAQAISQQIRNQNLEYIPQLFAFAQLLLAVNKNEARYATVGSSASFWGLWREEDDDTDTVAEIVHAPLNPEQIDALFSGEFASARRHFEELEAAGQREVTVQDEALYHLCRPERLLELAYRFTLFEGGEKRIARYQQYFVVKSTLARVKRFDESGARSGGMIWQTQGSGKSLTMVMLARNLALDSEIANPRIVLVTDRDDLDKQLKNTFAACGLTPRRATSGRNLLKLVSETDAAIITTLVHKFVGALESNRYVNDSPDVFVLVDESHRTQFGSHAAKMRQMFPRGCYLGFTGTPLMKKEKNNFLKFGGLIDPSYSMRQAVEDQAVVPLLYEGRHVVMGQDQRAIDTWFERYTQDLAEEQVADLKKKYARANMLSRADRVIYMRAFDISEHFCANWQGTGFKAQLVAPTKADALSYKRYLDELGQVTSQVVISGPDTREGWSDPAEEPTDEVIRFWNSMMAKYGDEATYNERVIDQFKNSDDPELLIVVHKLLTGFDAPRNTVLYLCRSLREHTLLQAIARVNRVFEGKEFGYVVDYEGALGELDQALAMYDALDGFDEADLTGTIASVNAEISKLPQRHADLLGLFKTVRNAYDEEAYEIFLADRATRDDFYERLSAYARTLAVALSSESFVVETDPDKVWAYKADLRRFEKLRQAVRFRFAESVDYRQYEPRIKKLLDTHIHADEVITLNEPVNIFDEAQFDELKQARGVAEGKRPAALADAIAHATKRAIAERMDEDPALYERFSEMIQRAIDDFLARRLSETEYLATVVDIRHKVVVGQHEDVPTAIENDEAAMAYFGVVRRVLDTAGKDGVDLDDVGADAALAIRKIFARNEKVRFCDDMDAQNRVRNEIDDYLYDVVGDERGVHLDPDAHDEVIECVMRVAQTRAAR